MQLTWAGNYKSYGEYRHYLTIQTHISKGAPELRLD